MLPRYSTYILSLSDHERWASRSDRDEDPPPPYSLEDDGLNRVGAALSSTLIPRPKKALPALSGPTITRDRSFWPMKEKSYAAANKSLLHLGHINLRPDKDRYHLFSYLLKIRSNKSITLFRSVCSPTSPGSAYAATENPPPPSSVTSVYSISRSGRGQEAGATLVGKKNDSLFSESASKLKFRKACDLRNNDVWKLYYHRNYEFESFIGMPATGSGAVLIFDTHGTWQERSGKIVAKERDSGTHQNHSGLRAGSEYTRLARIDISGGLDQRFVDLLVACWVAKAYFP